LHARAAFFVVVGVAVFAHWLVTDPSHGETVAQTGWRHVIAFSGVVAAIGAGIVILGPIVGCETRRPFVGAAGGAGVVSVANILEDGFAMGWAFFATVIGTGVLLVGLLATAVTTALKALPGRRSFALVPLGTALAILFYVEAGGPIMLATWLVAAALTASMSGRLQPLDEPCE
jgi:hypothetical protein